MSAPKIIRDLFKPPVYLEAEIGLILTAMIGQLTEAVKENTESNREIARVLDRVSKREEKIADLLKIIEF